MSGCWLTVTVALVGSLATSGALDPRVPVVDMTTFDVSSLVQRENEIWTLDVTVSWQRPDGIEPEGYMVELKDPYADVTTDTHGMSGGDVDFLDFGWDFGDLFGSPTTAAGQTARERLENRGFTFVEAESYSIEDIKFTRNFEIEVVVLKNNDSAGAGAVHRFVTPDCYSSTHDLDFCRQQDVVFSSKPANISLLNVSVTCVEVEEEDDSSEEKNEEDEEKEVVAMATVWISWLRPVQLGANVITYVIRLEHDGRVVRDGVFAGSVAEDLNRDPLVPILYHIKQMMLNRTYTLQVTPYVNKTDAASSPYGMAAQITFHTHNLPAELCFPVAGTEATTGSATFLAAGALSIFSCLYVIVGQLIHASTF